MNIVAQYAPANASAETVRHTTDEARASTAPRWVFLVTMLVATIALAVVMPRPSWELAGAGDEIEHAVTGLFFADLLASHPITHPLQFTYRFYAQYQALGLVHWPPFFHFVEGVMFLLLGRSLTVARITILLFMLLGLGYWFKLVEKLLGTWSAAFATLLLAVLPQSIFYTQSVMLSVPSLALAIVAVYYWHDFMITGNRRRMIRVAVITALAMLTYEHAGFLLLFFVLTLLGERKLRLLWNKRTAAAAGIAALLLTPFFLMMMQLHGASVAEAVVVQRTYRLFELAYYWRNLPLQMGWPALCLSASGVVALLYMRSTRHAAAWMLLWIAAFYCTFAFLSARQIRYAFFWLPPFAFFASWPLSLNLHSAAARAARNAACVVALCFFGVAGLGGLSRSLGADYGRYPYLSGYADAARYLARTNTGVEVVLLDDNSEVSPNLIFAMRVNDPQRRIILMRKALYVTNIEWYFGIQELARNSEDIQTILRSFGIRRIVIADDQHYLLPIENTLRAMLLTGQFRQAATIPVYTTASHDRGYHLLVYENLAAGPPTSPALYLKMLTLPHDLSIPFSEFGNH